MSESTAYRSLFLCSSCRGSAETRFSMVPDVLLVCLDGSPPAYHLARGFGSGVNSWLVHFEVSCSFSCYAAMKMFS